VITSKKAVQSKFNLPEWGRNRNFFEKRFLPPVILMKAELLFSLSSGFNGVFFVEKPSKVGLFPSDLDKCVPFGFLLFPVDADVAGCVVSGRFFVSAIFRGCYVSEVFDLVIEDVSIDVVDLLLWPLSVSDEPDDPMGVVIFSVDFEGSVSSIVYSSGDGSFSCGPSASDFPSQGFAIVREQLAGDFGSDHLEILCRLERMSQKATLDR